MSRVWSGPRLLEVPISPRSVSRSPRPSSNLLPTGGVYERASNVGVAGGLGTALGQVVRRDFPNQHVGVHCGIPLNNRFAQSDYAIEQLQLQQTVLSSQRKRNQIVADISNQVIALKQARAGYETAVSARELQEQLLQAEQDKFSFGSASNDAVAQKQRELVAAQSVEVAARASYAHARVSLDQMLGGTLEVNHLTLEEGERGRLARESTIPENAPKE
jgi:outer membrane protein